MKCLFSLVAHLIKNLPAVWETWIRFLGWEDLLEKGDMTGRLSLSLKFQNSPQTCLWEGFLLCGNFSSFTTPSPGQVSIPKSFVFVSVFYVLDYLLLKRLGCLSGCLVSSTSIQKLFCGSCSTFKWSFDEFVGEKVVSPAYSSTILGPLEEKVNF